MPQLQPPGSGVGLLVHRPQVGGTHMGVDLRGDEALMAQKFLDAADVSPPVQQVRGEAMAERMGRSAPIQAGGAQVFFQHPSDAAGGQAPAKAVDEDRRSRAGRLARMQAADGQPAAQGAGSKRSDGSEAFLAAFAAHAEDFGPEVYVAFVEAHQFADAESRRVHGFENGSIAKSHGRIGRRCCQEAR